MVKTAYWLKIFNQTNTERVVAPDASWSAFNYIHTRTHAHPLQTLFLADSNYNGRCAIQTKKKQKQKQKTKKQRKKKKGKADLTTVLHIRELPHLHVKLAVWFSFPTTNNKNPMIPSWSLVSIYNYSFNPDQIFTKNFEILELEICSKIFTCGMIFLQVNSSLPTSLKKYVLRH